MVDIAKIVEILLFPVVTLVMWSFLFNSKNSRFTKFVVEGGYIVFVIPIMVLTFLVIPFSAVAFWLNTTSYSKEIVEFSVGIMVVVTIVVEYFYIKRIVQQVEEKEKMRFWDVIKREFNSEYRKGRKLRQSARAEESDSYFDEISKMNDEKRQIDLDKRERLKRALLNEYE